VSWSASFRKNDLSESAAALKGAIANAYKFARAINFEGAYMRSDIGERALKAGEE